MWLLPLSAAISCGNSYHIASDDLGGNTVSGGKLKETGTTHWNSPNTEATNESIFTALPGGYRVNSAFYYIKEYGYWWTSTEGFPNNGKTETPGYDSGALNESFADKDDGLSVRCIKDL